MSNAKSLTTSALDAEVLKSTLPVMIDFWADWCAPCKVIAPAVDAVALQFDGKAKVLKVNVDEERGLASHFNIVNIPTLLFFKNGKVVDQVIGTTSKENLARKLQSLI